MDRVVFRWIVALSMAACCMLLPGCSCDGVAGTYSDADGNLKVELRGDGKAYVTMGALGTNAGEWEQDGERVIVKINGDSTVLTRNEDGSLNGGLLFGTLKKTE